MKKIFYILAVFSIAIALVGCNEFRYRGLFKVTDKVVESLYTDYYTYGLLGGPSEYTSDKSYKVMPIGRLVNVRIETAASTEDYNDLLEALERHYKGNPRVVRVYRCNAGTIMIDCRR